VIAARLSQAKLRLPLRFILALALMGLTELVAQVVLTRELLALFLGNELSIALVLAVWLVAVAAGSALGSAAAGRVEAPLRLFAGTQTLLACVLPVSLVLARAVHPGDITPGQVLGPGAVLLTAVVALTPVCLIGGFQFVIAARAAGALSGRHEGAVSPVAFTYALEAGGAVLGGIAFHFFMAEHVTPIASLGALGVVNVLSACTLLRADAARASKDMLLLPIAVGVLLAALVSTAGRAELATLRASPRWREVNPVAFVPSKYGALVVAKRAGQVSVYQSGVLLFTSQDEYSNEVVAHLALLEHSNPRRVLVIGGAVAGLAGEVLKHPVADLDCVELDPRVAELARRHLPSELTDPLSVSGVRLHLRDGRLAVRRARGEYDVIIVNLPDPTTGAINRFYTAEFFREVHRALAPGGVVALSLTGSSHHLSGAVLLAAATARSTLGSVFPESLIVPGDQMFLLAGKSPGTLSNDWQVLTERLEERRIPTDFVNGAWLRDALLPLRQELLLEVIEGEKRARLNTDLNPVSYYYQTRIWLDQLSSPVARALQVLSSVRVWWAAVPLALAALAVAATRGRSRRLARVAILVGAAAIGGFGLVVEVLALLAFQSACGYLYHALGALIAAFMAGLAIGSGIMSLRGMSERSAARILLAGLASAALICAVLPRVFAAVLAAPSQAAWALGLVLLLAGSMVGAIFPVATALYRRKQPAASAGGTVYAADLVGSAGAALAAGVIAVPLLGAAGTCYTAGILLAAALVLALPLCRE